MAFVDEHTLLTGGNDGKICRLNFSDKEKEPSLSHTYELKLRCKGMKTEGLKGENEKKESREIAEMGIGICARVIRGIVSRGEIPDWFAFETGNGG